MAKPKTLTDYLASFGLTCVILSLMYILTVIGTWDQQYIGLHSAQVYYFDSWFLWRDLGSVSVPMFPGGQLLMAALFVNLLIGGMVRLRKTWSRVGIFITHIGIAALLVSGLVRYHYADEGKMALWEGERSQWFESFYDWEISIGEVVSDGTISELLIPHEDLVDLGAASSRKFTSENLPFDVTVDGFLWNSMPQPHAPMMAARSGRVVDGFYLDPRGPAEEAEQNIAGCYIEVTEKGSGTVHEAILWGAESQPYVLMVDERAWSIGLHHTRWKLPFVTHLDATRRELYPRTQTPKSFESDVRKIEGGVEQEVLISMNEPLRHKGYVLYQSGWNEVPGRGRYSVFAVARNPSDQWPLISCIIISVGLVIHFLRKLMRFVRSETKRHA